MALAVLALALLLALPVIAAPDPGETCGSMLALVERAGEAVAGEDRSSCEARMEEIAEARGRLGWAYLAWCVELAQSVPEAGECL